MKKWEIMNLEELFKRLDTPRWNDIYEIENELRSLKIRLKLIFPYFKRTYINSGHWQCRKFILFHLLSYARRSPMIVDLAVMALSDRSNKVVQDAISICAYSLQSELIPKLEVLLNHKNCEVVQSAKNAINSIKYSNHHIYLNSNWRFGDEILIKWEVKEQSNYW